MRTEFNVITFLFLLTIGMTTKEVKNGIKLEDILYSNQQFKNVPNVEIRILLNDSLYKSDEKILVEIILTNKSKKIQRLLFDKPPTGTGGPWATYADVINNLTNESVLKYGNKLLLSSQIYTEDQLTDKYYTLRPEDTVKRKYELRDIVVFSSGNYPYPKGDYTLQMFYYTNSSNKVRFRIE